MLMYTMQMKTIRERHDKHVRVFRFDLSKRLFTFEFVRDIVSTQYVLLVGSIKSE
jgi:hypothetical protein